MISSDNTFLLKRRSALSIVSPSWSFTSATRRLRHGLIVQSIALRPGPLPTLAIASYRLCLSSRPRLGQRFGKLLAGLEARISFCGDADRLPSTRIAALTLLLIFRDEAAKPT